MATFIIPGKCATKGSANSFIDDQKPENDITRVMSYLTPLLRDYDPDRIVAFVHEGAPVSKARARWSGQGRHFYTPNTTSGPQAALSWKFRSEVKGETWKGNIAIAVVFFRPNRKRIDGDNLMKLVMDAGTKAGIWEDDCQVTHQVSVIEKDADRPRTVIALSPVRSSLDRNNTEERVCVACQKTFLWTRTKGTPAKYCSNACRIKSSDVTCDKCGIVFRQKRPAQKYCSRPCRNAVTLLRGRTRSN